MLPIRVSVLRAVALVACLPYIALKIAWVSGSRIGIPDGSMLLDDRATTAVSNILSVPMDAAVAVLALLLTQAWGRCVPGWLLLTPMWAATGLLAPIMTGYPLQLLVGVLTRADSGGAAGASSPPFLDGWVFAVVYGGFIVQGLALGTLAVRYAARRWGHLWQGRMRDREPGGNGVRATALVSSLVCLGTALPHVLWASGSTGGLPHERIIDRTSDYYVLEGVIALFAVLATVGTLLLLSRRPTTARIPVAVPVAMVWIGSAATGCWSAWMLLSALVPNGQDRGAAWVLTLIYAVAMAAGCALVISLRSLLPQRSAP
ncbi:hypothetical protein QR77_07745 [Streptomyces sp. 150FB]|nr:hypothetical protein QR77_07745 [Streptomyces sp. 150FB]